MAKIDEDAAYSLMWGLPFSRGNTKVNIYPDGCREMLLHGNCIAWITYDNRLYISHSGWMTKTTKMRLNALPCVSIKQRDFMWFLNEDYWTGTKTEIKRWIR